MVSKVIVTDIGQLLGGNFDYCQLLFYHRPWKSSSTAIRPRTRQRPGESGDVVYTRSYATHGVTRMTTYFDVGVLLVSATLSSGTRTLVSGK